MSGKYDIVLDFKSDDPAERLNSFQYLLNRVVNYAYFTHDEEEEDATDPRENFVFLILIISTMYKGATGRHEIENEEIARVTGLTNLEIRKVLTSLKDQGILSYLFAVSDKKNKIDWHFEFDLYRIAYGKTNKEAVQEKEAEEKRDEAGD